MIYPKGTTVKLTADFNNEPGSIPAGTEGTVLKSDLHYIYVQFADVSKLTLPVQQINADCGLPMLRPEIEKVN